MRFFSFCFILFCFISNYMIYLGWIHRPDLINLVPKPLIRLDPEPDLIKNGFNFFYTGKETGEK